MANEASMSSWEPVREGAANKFSISLDPRLICAALLTAVGYYVGSLIGFTLTFQPHPVSVLWPPNSILLAALLLVPPRAWVVVLLAALPAHIAAQLQSHIPLPMMFCYFISNSCEAIIGAGCIRYLIRGPVRFESLHSTTIFCIFGALVGPFLSSFLDAGFVQLNHWGVGHYWEIWRVRFFSNVLAELTFAPAILIWFGQRGRRQKHAFKQWAEAGLLFLGLLAVCFLALYKEGALNAPVWFCAPVPFLLWAALRFGRRGTGSAILIVTFLTIWSAAHGHGPFTTNSPEENARSIQLFLIVMAIPFLFLAAGIAERRTAEERFTKAFRANPDAASITRLSDGMYLDVNEQWLAMFGYTRDEVIGRTVFELNIYASLADHAEMIERMARDEIVRDFESSMRIKNGKVLRILLSAELVETAGDTCLIAVARDVTDVKRVEEANRNLAHASRLAVVGELTSSIAHEINQPLGAILSNADAAEMLLESESPPLDELRKILVDIRNDDMRASETIRSIRMLTRKHKMQLESLEFDEVASEVLRLVSSEARRRNVSLLTDLRAAPATIFGDRVHLQQVLMNLILNGMEAMAETPEMRRQLLVRTKKNGAQKVQVSVTDSGHGISPKNLPRLFESFYTTKDNGMGLGLAIARSIVDFHGGEICAENNDQGGATFRFDLPLNNQTAIPL
jgi:two-component system, LuxR family, sensor kinase FixL